MRSHILFALWTLATTAISLRAETKLELEKIEYFEKQVRPLLVSHCFSCHGPEKQQAELRVDSREALLKGGKSGPALVPGNVEKSLLVQPVHRDETIDLENRLTDHQFEVLSMWIKAGAAWTDPGTIRIAATSAPLPTPKDRAFWSFQPIRRPTPPAVRGSTWTQSPIDRFVLSKLWEKGLHPSAAADKRTLIRRVTFDLIGLPATPQEIDAFLSDESPAAFARVVDRLLASPHFGERWARHWLDVARYGEDQAHTFQARKYPDGFRYRDWVVRAFNSDMPYDRFLMEQIAGDLLDGPNRADRLAALGFFALGPVYYGKAVDDELDDRIDTLSRGILGLTVACARCHEHKFDPIFQHDYYALQGVFASTTYKEYVLLPDGGLDEKAVSDPIDKMVREKKPTEKRKPVLHSLTEGPKPANVRIQIRGNPTTLGDEVPRRFLAILSNETPTKFTRGSGRLELAEAIVSKQNPLTARVMVNRVWHHLFGRGIVATPSNFGSLGQPPSHPELLDYLASRFMANGWSIKALIRDIVLSATYQQSSRHDATAMRIDPDNQYLGRMNRKRLEVEPWRDAMLAVAGNLEARLGGPSVDLSAANNQRRTLYGGISRHQLDPLLRLFDFPDPNLTADRRPVTSVPLQQLFVLNSEFMARQAKKLAARITVSAKDDQERIRSAFLLVFGRLPGDREVELAAKYLSISGSAGWEQYAQVLLSANEFAFID